MAQRGSVYRRGRTWTFHVSWKQGGKLRQIKRGGFRTRGDATAALNETLGSLQGARYVTPTRTTVAGYFDGWLEARTVVGLAPSTLVSYRSNIETYVVPRIGHIELQELDPTDLDAMYGELLTSGNRHHGPLSARTVRYVHTIVSAALGDAERKQLITRNPARSSSPPSASAARAPEMPVWTGGELATFLSGVRDHFHGPLFRTAAMTGLRRGELCGLRWGDVDLDAGTLTVRRSITAVRGTPIGGPPKTTRSRRTLELDAETVAILRQHRRAQRERRMLLGSGWRDVDTVFDSGDGSPLHADLVSRTFAREVARSGLPRIRLHDLRHTHATHLLAAGESPRLVSERMGHSSLAFTLGTYGHVLPGQQRDAVTRLAAAIDGTVTP